ncbi:hypothetical protein OC846_003750 [Tilletia horrida]|uniref:TPR-like protein n=1 Tax=Tilletia horrida TaxID=155126 RepID=A0AAN6JTJ9_9BASI|nr:hypothetical protein OC846_003750 [Tilletia horrida]
MASSKKVADHESEEEWEDDDEVEEDHHMDQEDQEAEQQDEEEEDDDDDDYENQDWGDEDEAISEQDNIVLGSEADTLLTQLRELAPTPGSYLDPVLTHLRSILNSARSLPTLQASIEKFAIFVSRLFFQVAKQEQQNPQHRIKPGSYAHLITAELISKLDVSRGGLVEYGATSKMQQRAQYKQVTRNITSVHRCFRMCAQVLKHFVGKHDDVDHRIALSSRFQHPIKDETIRRLIQDTMDHTEDISRVATNMPPPLETLQILYDAINGIQCYHGAEPRSFLVRGISFQTEQIAAAFRRDCEEKAVNLFDDFIRNGDATFDDPEVLSSLCDLGFLEVWANRPEAGAPYFLVIAADARHRLESDPADDHARITLARALCAVVVVEHQDEVFNIYDIATEAVQVIRPLFESKPDICHLVMASALFQVANIEDDDDDEHEARLPARLEAAQEAVQLYTLASEADPTDMALKASLARAHRALAIRLDDLEKYDECDASFDKAVALYRELAAYMPELHKNHLANCLALYAEKQDTEKEETARAAENMTKEANALLESLAADWPLSTSRHLFLGNLSLTNIFIDQDRLEAGIEPATKAIKYCKAFAQLTETNQDEFVALIYALRAHIWVGLEKWTEGLADSKESLRLYRALNRDNSMQSVTATGMSTVAWCEWMLGHDKRVVSLYEKALKMLGTVLKREGRSNDFEDEMVVIQARLSGAQLWSGLREQALETGSAAVQTARTCIAVAAAKTEAEGNKKEEEPKITQHTLGQALTFLAGAHFALDQFKEAAQASGEAVEVMEEAKSTPSRLKTGLLLHKRCLQALGRTEEAAAVQKKADELPLHGYADMIGRVKGSSE